MKHAYQDIHSETCNYETPACPFSNTKTRDICRVRHELFQFGYKFYIYSYNSCLNDFCSETEFRKWLFENLFKLKLKEGNCENEVWKGYNNFEYEKDLSVKYNKLIPEVNFIYSNVCSNFYYTTNHRAYDLLDGHYYKEYNETIKYIKENKELEYLLNDLHELYSANSISKRAAERTNFEVIKDIDNFVKQIKNKTK